MKLLVSLAILPFTLALTRNDIEFGVRYFTFRNVKYICLLSCEVKSWVHFAKYSSSRSIRASTVLLDKFDPIKIDSCTSQGLGEVGVLIETNCPAFDDVLYYSSQNSLFDSIRKWHVLDTNVTEYNRTISSEIVQWFGELNISVNADLVLSYETKYGYQMYEIYNHGKIQGGELIINDLGVWNDEQGFNAELNEYKYYRRWDFKQLSMRMIVVMTVPTKVFDPTWLTDRRATPGLATLLKPSGMVLNEVADIHNFKYTYTIMDRWIGIFNYNDSRKVVATAMYYKFHDISPSIRFNPNLISKINIVHPPLTSIETRYFYRIPTFGPGRFENQFMRPFSPGAWLSVAFISTLCGCLLLLAAKLERRPSSGQYAIFTVLASVCQQFFEDNFTDTRRISSARQLTILVTGLACVLFYNYYTSSVVSWLLNGPPPSINSLQELLDSPLELIYEDVGYTRSWLKEPDYYFNKKNMKIENLMRQKKVLNRKTSEVLTTLDKGIAMVKAGGYAFHTEVDSANRIISQTFTQDELCELGSVQSMEKTVLYAVVQVNSPYIEFLNWSLKRLMERGIVSNAQHRTRSSQVRCEGSSPRALALGGAAPAFLLLAAGYVLALAIMMLERLAVNKNLQLVETILQ